MALYSIRNERDLVVFNGIATETTAATVASGADPGEGQIVAATGAAVAGKAPFKFVYKHLDGRYRSSDVINPDKITYFKKQAPVSEVLPKDVVTVGTATAGNLYEIIVKIFNDGSLSLENCVMLVGSYTALAADTATTIATALVASLNAAQTRMGQDYFTISNAAGAITLQSKRLPFVTGKKDGRIIDFVTQATQVDPSTFTNTGLAIVKTGATVNPCSITFLKDLEWQTRGAFADSYRGLGYPNNFEFSSDIVSTTAYTLYEFGFYDGDRNDHAVQKSPRQITVAVPAANVAAFDTTIAKALQTINLATAATDGQILKYSAAAGAYVPAADV